MTRLPIVVALAVSCSSPAFAQYDLFANGTTTTIGGADDFHLFDVDGVKSFEDHVSSAYGSEDATIDAKANFGVLKAKAYAVGSGVSAATTELFTDDTLTFHNPYGPTTTAEFNLHVDGNMVAPAPTLGGVTEMILELGDPSNPTVGTAYLRHYSGGNLLQSVDSTPFVYTIANDSPINLRNLITIQVFSDVDGVPVTANYYDTVTATIQVLTPGATYTSASGHQYKAVSTPSPGSVVMFGLSAALGLRRRRRQDLVSPILWRDFD